MTGFQEIQKFMNHLRVCKKYPDRKVLPSFIDEDGNYNREVNITCISINDALKIRADSVQ